jgi:hypothetical protein
VSDANGTVPRYDGGTAVFAFWSAAVQGAALAAICVLRNAI